MTTGPDLSGLLIGSTIAAFKCDDMLNELNWLQHADAWRERGARFACALQVGQGHDKKLQPLQARLDYLTAVQWTFSVDQGEDMVDSDNRLIAICTGRNLIQEIAQRDQSVTAILFLDTDVLCPEDLPERLLEVNHPMVGGNVPHYCLDGPKAGWIYNDWGDAIDWVGGRDFPKEADVREHWNTAGCLLVRRPVFREIAWSWDAEGGHTDDPHYQLRAAKQFGQTWVRHDVTVLHEPLIPMEQRGHDRRVIR